MSDVTIIKSLALYPREGIAYMQRRAGVQYKPVGEWPVLAEGQELEIHDNQGWMWRATVLSVQDGDNVQVKVQGERTALPMPPIVDGVIVLPNLSGHAHTRDWARGDIVVHNDAYYKVRSAKLNNQGDWNFGLEASTAEAYATRPDVLRYSNERALLDDLGSAVQTKTGEWFHVTKATKSSFSGALGRDYTYWGKGKYVSAEKAEKINATHPRLLDGLLAAISGERVEKMPEGAVVLLPRNMRSLAVTGTRVAVEGNAIYHERCGDPDRLDSWYHYVVRIEGQPELVKRVKAYVKKVSK